MVQRICCRSDVDKAKYSKLWKYSMTKWSHYHSQREREKESWSAIQFYIYYAFDCGHVLKISQQAKWRVHFKMISMYINAWFMEMLKWFHVIIVVMMKVTCEKFEARINFIDIHLHPASAPVPATGEAPISPRTQLTNWSFNRYEWKCSESRRAIEFQKSKSNSSRQTIRENHSCKSIDEQATRNDDFRFRNDFRMFSENHFQATTTLTMAAAAAAAQPING